MDRQLIKDEALRKAIELQIAHFGQIPQQLFRTPHPPRQVVSAKSVINLTQPRPLKKNYFVPPTPITAPSPLRGSRLGAAISPMPHSLRDREEGTDQLGLGVNSSSGNTNTNNNSNTLESFGYAPPVSDEEEISILSKCAMLTRRNPGLTLRRSSNQVTAMNIGTSIGASRTTTSSLIPDGSGDLRPPPRTAVTSNLTATLGVGNILAFFISTERVVAVVDSGVIEVYRSVLIPHLNILYFIYCLLSNFIIVDCLCICVYVGISPQSSVRMQWSLTLYSKPVDVANTPSANHHRLLPLPHPIPLLHQVYIIVVALLTLSER